MQEGLSDPWFSAGRLLFFKQERVQSFAFGIGLIWIERDRSTCVFQCRNKLDDCVYAIKKIAFQDMKPDLFLKVRHQVNGCTKLT